MRIIGADDLSLPSSPSFGGEIQLETRQLVLRELANGDATAVAQYLSEWDVVKQTTSVPFPYDERSALTWIARVRNRMAEGLQYAFAITRRDDGLMIGTVAVGILNDTENRHGEIGYWLGKPHWGFGFAPEAVIAVTEYALNTIELAHIEAAVFKDNVASARVLEKSGYRLERAETRHYPDRGGKRKILLYAARENDLKEDIS